MGRLDREVTLLGVTMELRYWIIGFIFLVIAIICFLIAILYTPPVQDVVSVGVGIVSALLTALTWTHGATRRQVSTFMSEFREFRNEFRELRNEFRELRDETVKELRGIRSTLEELSKVLIERR